MTKRYSPYFKQVIKDGGLINLSSYYQSQVLNIGALEYAIEMLKKLNKDSHKYDLNIFSQQKLLTDITGNLDPEDLFKQMVMLSKKDF